MSVSLSEKGASSAMTSSHSDRLKMPKERMWTSAPFFSVKLPRFCLKIVVSGSSLSV